jgi:hypothetical protein
MASFELRDYVEAYLTLRDALESDVRALTDRQRGETEELRDRAGSFLGHLFVETVPELAEVTIDLEPMTPDPDGNIYVNVGEHSIQVVADGYVPQTQRFMVEGGEGKRIRIVLEEIPPPPPPPPPEEPSPWPLILMSTGGAFLVATGVGVGWYVNRKNETQKCVDAENDPMFGCTNLGTLEGQRDAALAFTLVMAGIALSAGMTGLILWLTDDTGDPEEPDGDAARAFCAPSLGAVVCAGRF